MFLKPGVLQRIGPSNAILRIMTSHKKRNQHEFVHITHKNALQRATADAAALHLMGLLSENNKIVCHHVWCWTYYTCHDYFEFDESGEIGMIPTTWQI